jgi:hypothetical protein
MPGLPVQPRSHFVVLMARSQPIKSAAAHLKNIGKHIGGAMGAFIEPILADRMS